MLKPVFALLIFFSLILLQSCALPRCKDRFCGVRMVHFHSGYEYRGVSLYEWYLKYKNPRYGEGYGVLVKDPAAVQKGDKNGYSTKVKAHNNKTKIKTGSSAGGSKSADNSQGESTTNTSNTNSTNTSTESQPK